LVDLTDILLEQNFKARVALVCFEVCARGFFTIGRKIVLQRDCVPGAKRVWLDTVPLWLTEGKQKRELRLQSYRKRNWGKKNR
jgi:hypothetical protein